MQDAMTTNNKWTMNNTGELRPRYVDSVCQREWGPNDTRHVVWTLKKITPNQLFILF